MFVTDSRLARLHSPAMENDGWEVGMMGKIVGYACYGLSGMFALSAATGLVGGLSGGEALTPVALTAALLLAVAYGFYRLGKRQSGGGAVGARRVEVLAEQTQAMFNEVNERGGFVVAPTQRYLSTPARPALLTTTAKLYEFKSRRVSNHVGTRVNFGGMPLLLGQSTSRSHSDLEATATGELVLTAQALVFNGDQRSVEIKLANINGLELHLDGLTVSSTTRQKPISFTVDNPLLWVQLVKNLSMFQLEDLRLPAGQRLQAR